MYWKSTTTINLANFGDHNVCYFNFPVYFNVSIMQLVWLRQSSNWIETTQSVQTFCSDFRYESNGIFVLGVGFFLQTNFDFLTSYFWRNCKKSFKRFCCLELKFEKVFNLWLFFLNLWGFKNCHFGEFGTINVRFAIDLIRLRNRSKLVQSSLYAITNLLIGAKSITLFLVWRVGGIFLQKNLSFFLKSIFFSLSGKMSCYYCSIDLKRQSEHSWLRPDSSSLVLFYYYFAKY